MKCLLPLLIGIALLFLNPQLVHSQNLVVNPSFEIQSNCPYGQGMIDRATPWLRGRATPDYLHTCPGTSCCDLPSNYFGYENAATGNGCAGGLFYGSFANYYLADFREFLYGTLSAPLNPGQTYYVSFKVNLVDTASFACNNLGIQFENAYTTGYPLNNRADVYTTSIINQTTGWVTIQGTFVPASAFTNFYVGNFFADSMTSIINVGSTANDWMAYYYVDDFCVSPQSWECGSFLPVTWGGIVAMAQPDHQVQITWEVNNEEDAAEYWVERSPDGVVFEKAGTITPSVEKDIFKTYQYLDNTLIQGQHIYYRIRLIDTDGSTHSSNIVRVWMEGSDENAFSISPNPIQIGQKLTIETNLLAGEKLTIQLLDEWGKLIWELPKVELSEDHICEVIIPEIQAGLYHLLMKGDHEIRNERLIILD